MLLECLRTSHYNQESEKNHDDLAKNRKCVEKHAQRSKKEPLRDDKLSTKRSVESFARCSTVKEFFSFDLSNGPIKATSGGVVSHMKGNETGFVLVGKGVSTIGRSNPYKNDLVFAIRGTDAASDWSSDFRTSICVSESGKTIHSGFNEIFEIIKGPLAKHVEQMKPGGTLHCVGHSLGGALALMVADWVKSTYSYNVRLYSFGAPKVGYTDFALSATNRIGVKNIYRCVNGGDVVPMVPVWPFMHVPYNSAEYRLDNNKLINPMQHKMVRYSRNCTGQTWSLLIKRLVFIQLEEWLS